MDIFSQLHSSSPFIFRVLYLNLRCIPINQLTWQKPVTCYFPVSRSPMRKYFDIQLENRTINSKSYMARSSKLDVLISKILVEMAQQSIAVATKPADLFCGIAGTTFPTPTAPVLAAKPADSMASKKPMAVAPLPMHWVNWALQASHCSGFARLGSHPLQKDGSIEFEDGSAYLKRATTNR